MRLFLEPKPNSGVTTFFKSNYFVPVLISYEFETAVKIILDLVSY